MCIHLRMIGRHFEYDDMDSEDLELDEVEDVLEAYANKCLCLPLQGTAENEDCAPSPPSPPLPASIPSVGMHIKVWFEAGDLPAGMYAGRIEDITEDNGCARISWDMGNSSLVQLVGDGSQPWEIVHRPPQPEWQHKTKRARVPSTRLTYKHRQGQCAESVKAYLN